MILNRNIIKIIILAMMMMMMMLMMLMLMILCDRTVIAFIASFVCQLVYFAVVAYIEGTFRSLRTVARLAYMRVVCRVSTAVVVAG